MYYIKQKNENMGFGFNLFFIFVLYPLSAALLINWLWSKKAVYGKILGEIWLSIIVLAVILPYLFIVISYFFEKKKLTQNDFYGSYVIDRSFFEGKQADWQYEHFRFEITRNDSIFFYVTEKEYIVKTYKGSIKTVKPYHSERLIIEMQQPTHHILASNPTIYRRTWDFYMVFASPKFHNVFFRKGKWKKLTPKN